jgi:hypothetical protein
VEAIAEYDAYTDLRALFDEGPDGHTGTLEIPLQAVILPGGAGFLTLHQEWDPKHDAAAQLELRRYMLTDGRAVVVETASMAAEPQARGRGSNIVRMSAEGTALLLNRYVVAFDTALFGTNSPDG